MARKAEHPGPPAESVACGYERDDLRLRWFVFGVIAVIVGALVMHTGLWFLLAGYGRILARNDVPGSAVQAPVSSVVVPLQPTPSHDLSPGQDLETVRRREDRVFQALGWHVDPRTHRVQLPSDLLNRMAARNRATSKPAGGAQ